MMHLNELPNQRPDEQVILFMRRHWFALLAIFSSFILLVGTPLLLGWYFYVDLVAWMERPVLGPMTAILVSLYFMSMWLFAFVEIMDYYLDTWIVTSERVIAVEQNGLFHRVSSELDLSAIQDVTSEVTGFFPTLFNYGQVFVQTAGEKTRFHFKNIDMPEHVREVVNKLVEEDKRRIASLSSS